MAGIPVSLILLVGVAVIAVAVAAYAAVTERQRRAVVNRAGQFGDRSLVLAPDPPGVLDRFVEWVSA